MNPLYKDMDVGNTLHGHDSMHRSFQDLPIQLIEYIFRFLLGDGQINSARCLLEAFPQYKHLFLIVTDHPGSDLSSSRTLFCVPGIRTIGLMEYESLLATPKEGFPDSSETLTSIVILSYQWFMPLEPQGIFSRFGGCAHQRAIQRGSIVLVSNMSPQPALSEFEARTLISPTGYIDYRGIIQQWSNERGAALVYRFFSRNPIIDIIPTFKPECIDVDGHELHMKYDTAPQLNKRIVVPLVVKWKGAKSKSYSFHDRWIDTGAPSHSKDFQFFDPSTIREPSLFSQIWGLWGTELEVPTIGFTSLTRMFMSDEILPDIGSWEKRWSQLPQFPLLEELTLFLSYKYTSGTFYDRKGGKTIRLNAPRLRILKVAFSSRPFPFYHDVNYHLQDPPANGFTFIMDYTPWNYHRRGIDVSPRQGPDPSDNPLPLMIKKLVLNGIHALFLQYVDWGKVESLYWKRLEVYGCSRSFPVRLRCPQLSEIKLFISPNELLKIPKISYAPKLEKLVLVELDESVDGPVFLSMFMDTQVYTPSQLRHLTFSRHHSCKTVSPSPVTAQHLKIVEPFISHLYIHRHVPAFLDDHDLRLTELEYLELDVTLIKPNVDGVTKVVIREFMFPKLKTLILSLPQRLNDSYRSTGPLVLLVPQSCDSICISSVLMRDLVMTINGAQLVLPRDYMAHTKSEIHLNYTRNDKWESFVYDGLVMTPAGRSMEDCIESQWSDFDQVRKPR